MTIKAIAFSAQQRIAERCGISIQRSHIYESLAAAFGFASYASFCAEWAFDAGPQGRPVEPRTVEGVAQRLDELGYGDALTRQLAIEVTTIVSEHGVRAARIDQIIDSLLSIRGTLTASDVIEEDIGDEYGDPLGNDAQHLADDFGASAFLCSGLEDAAKRGNAKAHYALALILRADETPVGSAYWHDRQAQGEPLSGVQLEWANAYQEAVAREAARLRHLREAARLGHPDACVDAAEEFEDPVSLKQIAGAAVRDPLRASEVAGELGQPDHARDWCAAAAQAGDVEAMRRMIEVFDRNDLLKRWTWLHFAKLLGTDLTADDYWVVNEDGSEYDDAVGGPGFPMGADRISLPDLDEAQDAEARRLASLLAQRRPHVQAPATRRRGD